VDYPAGTWHGSGVIQRGRQYSDSLLVLWLSAACAPLHASDWTVTPGVGIAGTYSDNIELAPPEQEQSSFVAEVAPQISIRRDGRRLNLGFNYNLQALYRTHQSEAEVFHQFAGDARSELVREWLFLDFATTFSQQNLLATDLGGDNIANQGERTDVFTYAVSPFLNHRFGTFGTAEARFTFADVDNSETFGATTNIVDLVFDSGGDFQRTPWQVFYQRQEDNPSEGEDSEFQRIGGRLGYQFTSQVGVFSILGYEKNEFVSLQPESDRNGFSWVAGASWTPSRRTQIEGGYGERPFGETYFADLSYRGRRTSWQASYTEDFTTTTQAQLEQQAALIADSVIEDAIETVPIPPPSLITEQVFLSRRFQGSLSYLWRRTNASISLFTEDRSFETTGDDERIYGGALGIGRALSRKNNLGVTVAAQRIQDSATDIENTLWQAGFQFNRTVNKYVTGVLNYSYQQQDSDVATEEYTENRVTLGIVLSFQPSKI
jgi:uncharacterized protein (PEP-CTERM system associated)